MDYQEFDELNFMNEKEFGELRAELAVARAQIEQLRQSNEELQKYLRDRDDTIRQAKDITPVTRVSLKRLLILARAAFLDVVKIPKVDGGGWFLNMGLVGSKPCCQRRFKSLRQIWNLLNVESWNLSDLFDESISLNSQQSVAKPILVVSNWAGRLIGGERQNSFDTWNYFVNVYGELSSG